MKRKTMMLAGMALWLTLAALVHAGTVHYYYTDPQGSVLAKTDAQGNVIATNHYQPYGGQSLRVPDGPGYTGQVQDADTGLVYMQARYYDPGTGQFLSPDPVNPAAGNLYTFNRYDYGNNNPVINIDPDGRQETSVEPPPPDEGVDSLGNPLEGPNIGTASPFIQMQGESSSDFAARQAYEFARMDATPEKNAADDARADATADKANKAADRQTGSYTNLHESGKTYSGKGDASRSQVSARRVEKETGDKHVATDWTSAPSQRDAFKQESGRIDANGGPASESNYNKIESPGKKMKQQDSGAE